MNAALAEVVAQAASAESAAPGTCHVCRAQPARTGCHGCAARVCLKDRWAMFGLCKRCLRPADLRRWHHEGRVEDANWIKASHSTAAPRS